MGLHRAVVFGLGIALIASGLGMMRMADAQLHCWDANRLRTNVWLFGLSQRDDEAQKLDMAINWARFWKQSEMAQVLRDQGHSEVDIKQAWMERFKDSDPVFLKWSVSSRLLYSCGIAAMASGAWLGGASLVFRRRTNEP